MRFILLFYRAQYDTKMNLTACCTIVFPYSANHHFVFWQIKMLLVELGKTAGRTCRTYFNAFFVVLWKPTTWNCNFRYNLRTQFEFANFKGALTRPVFLLVPFVWSLFCLRRQEKQWLYTSLLLFLFKWLLLAIPIHSCIYCSIHSDLQNPRSPVAPCNLNCSCSLAYINPVCGQDKLTYFSACHAGCTKVTGSKVRNT